MAMPLKTLVRQRLDELGRSVPEATEKGGLSRTFIYDLLDGPEDRNVRGSHFAKLAVALDMTPAQLAEAISGSASAPVPNNEVELAPTISAPQPLQMAKDVPIMGTAMGSVFENVEGFAFEGGPIDYARRPPALATIKGLYAIYVVNDSMWPMHQAGEIRFVNPHRPPQLGGTVIVQTRKHEEDPGQAYIKILRRRTATKIVLEQLNPAATIEIPMEYVRSIHHVYTMNELFGV